VSSPFEKGSGGYELRESPAYKDIFGDGNRVPDAVILFCSIYRENMWFAILATRVKSGAYMKNKFILGFQNIRIDKSYQFC